MPIAEHEKLGVRARPSSDSFVGVPFKKRLILFTRSPSPPSRSPSPLPQSPLAALEDCGVQCKPESSESKSPPPLPLAAPEDCGIQLKPESSELESLPHLPVATPEDCGLQRKPESLESKSPSPLSSAASEDCFVQHKPEPQCKPELSESEFPVSEACNHPVQVKADTCNISAMRGKEVSFQPGEEPKSGDLNTVGKPDIVHEPSDPGLGLNVVGNSVIGPLTKRNMVLNDNPWPAMGSMQLPSVTQDALGMPLKVGSDEGKIVQSEVILMKHQNIKENPLFSKYSDPESTIDSGHLSLSRSNWDLNTTMDTWEGSKTDSNSETVPSGRLELGELHKEVLGTGLEQSLYEEASGSNVTLGNCNVLTNDQELKLINRCTLMAQHRSSEASLDLHFKPSFFSNNGSTSANFQSLREMPFLNLSMKPKAMVSSHGPQVDINIGVKSEHCESSCKDNKKADEMGNPNSLVVQHVKSEPCEGHETSKTNVLGDLNSVCSVGVKLEPLGDLPQGCFTSPEVKSFSMEKVGHALSLQIKELHRGTGKTDGSSDSTCNLPESKNLEGRSLLMEQGGRDLSLQSADVLHNAHKYDSSTSHPTGTSSGLDERMLHGYSQNCGTNISGYSNDMVSKAVKPEPLEDQSQGCFRSPEGIPSQVEPRGHDISHKSTELHESSKKSDGTTCRSSEFKNVEGHDLSLQSAEVLHDPGKVDCKTSDLTCKSVLDARTSHSETHDPSTDISEYSDDIVAKALDAGKQDSTHGSDLPPDSISPDPAKVTLTKPSHSVWRPRILPPDLVVRTMIPDCNEPYPVKELCETDNMPLLPESLASDSKMHMTTDGLSKSMQMDSFAASEIDEPPVGQYENCKVFECDEIKVMIDTSSETLDKLCEFESNKLCRSEPNADISFVANRTFPKPSGMNEEYFEDGEVRDMELSSDVEEPSEERQNKQVKDSSYINPVEVPLPLPSLVKENISIQNSMEVEFEIGSYGNKDVPSFASVGVLSLGSCGNQPNKTFRETSKDSLKMAERKSKPDAILSTDRVTKGYQVGVNNQENTEGSHLMPDKISELCQVEPSQNDGAAKDVAGRGQHSRIIYLSSASNKFASEKINFDSGRSTAWQMHRENPADRSFKRDRSRSWGSRDESSNDKFQKFEVERRPFQQGGKHVTDFMRNRSRADDRLIPMHGNKDTGSDQFREHMNNMTGVRFSRRVNDSEISASDGSSRMIRKPTNEEMQNLSRMPSRGRSPERRGQVMMVRHPIRGISPRRSIEREIPDFVLAHEENLLRNLPEGMMEPPIPSNPSSQYEREGMLVRRERRSLSPGQRRGTALHLPGPNPLSRAQQRSSHQWSAPKRSPDGYTGPAGELVRCRSPQMIRLGRMRSPPQQRPCFQEDMMVRRRGSPTYDAMHMVPPARERDFPRQMRGPNRDMRRFNLIDNRGSAEGYFGPPNHMQNCEFAEDEDYPDSRRRCEERRGPVRSSRQRCVTGDDDDEESFRFHVEDGPPRSYRECPDTSEAFCEEGSPRDFNGRFRNRLGNTSGRLRGIMGEQDNDYSHQEGQGWREPGFGEVRMKRRRF